MWVHTIMNTTRNETNIQGSKKKGKDKNNKYIALDK
jgi:hypothetical protein